MTREIYRFADLTLDVGAARVSRDGQPLPLARLSFDLLVVLVRRAPDVVGAEELIAEVWVGTAVADETLTQRVTLLRKSLGDDAAAPRYVRAVRGRGYQLVPAVLRGSLPPSAPLSRQGRSRIGWHLMVAVVLLGIAVGSGVFLRRDAPAAPEALATRPASAEELLARADAYLARERSEDNGIALDLYRRAHEAGSESAAGLAGWSLALAQRATKFNGSADDIEQALAKAQRAVELAPELARGHHALGLALDARGRVESAIAAYRRAVALEPSDRAALASAAHLLAVRGELAAALEANLGAAQGTSPRPPYLEVQVGTVLGLLGYRAAAAVWLERALALQPDNVFAALSLARLRFAEGRPTEADQVAARALAAGTRRPELPVVRARAALLAGDEPAARRHLVAAREVNPRYGFGRSLELLLDRRSGSTDALETARRERLAELTEGREKGDEWPDSWLEQALLDAAFEPTASPAPLGALDRAIALGFRDADLLLVDPFAAELRARTGVAARVERIRQLVAVESQGVAGAPWLPAGLLTGNAASR
ncbi:MAG: winged helix-turn-helix domain-containing protein [Thermoanaerobaculia bacterium]|nr:winged helix-turn-helix domain-containing protein [Thermoanaerobaculia bacterium]